MRISAYLHIAMGALSLLLAFVLLVILGGFAAFVSSQGSPGGGGFMAIFAVVAGTFFAIVSLPSIIGGVAVLKGYEWGKILLLILSAIELFSFPLGTALGVYSFWAFLRTPEPPARGYPPSARLP
ncbi:MAG: hypothetical protein ACFB21_13605 [Opitutales bacterium]